MPAVFTPGPLSGLVIIQPQMFPDARGVFFESYKASEYEKAGVLGPFVQDNQSRSHRGVLRGLHFQKEPHAQGKLVRVVKGAVWDVAVDIRPGSPTRGRWFGLELSEENRLTIFIPPGFAHGFLTLSDDAELLYKCTFEYHRDSDAGIRWDDPDLAIEWPALDVPLLISDKDLALPFWGGRA